MSKKKEEVLDPTLPFREITLDGKTYKMCLDHGALCDAESRLIQAHPEVNLLYVLPNLTGSNSRILFAMSLARFHPELTYGEALKLVNNRNALEVAASVMSIYQETNPEVGQESSGPQ